VSLHHTRHERSLDGSPSPAEISGLFSRPLDHSDEDEDEDDTPGSIGHTPASSVAPLWPATVRNRLFGTSNTKRSLDDSSAFEVDGPPTPAPADPSLAAVLRCVRLGSDDLSRVLESHVESQVAQRRESAAGQHKRQTQTAGWVAERRKSLDLVSSVEFGEDGPLVVTGSAVMKPDGPATEGTPEQPLPRHVAHLSDVQQLCGLRALPNGDLTVLACRFGSVDDHSADVVRAWWQSRSEVASGDVWHRGRIELVHEPSGLSVLRSPSVDSPVVAQTADLALAGITWKGKKDRGPTVFFTLVHNSARPVADSIRRALPLAATIGKAITGRRCWDDSAALALCDPKTKVGRLALSRDAGLEMGGSPAALLEAMWEKQKCAETGAGLSGTQGSAVAAVRAVRSASGWQLQDLGQPTWGHEPTQGGLSARDAWTIVGTAKLHTEDKPELAPGVVVSRPVSAQTRAETVSTVATTAATSMLRPSSARSAPTRPTSARPRSARSTGRPPLPSSRPASARAAASRAGTAHTQLRPESAPLRGREVPAVVVRPVRSHAMRPASAPMDPPHAVAATQAAADPTERPPVDAVCAKPEGPRRWVAVKIRPQSAQAAPWQKVAHIGRGRPQSAPGQRPQQRSQVPVVRVQRLEEEASAAWDDGVVQSVGLQGDARGDIYVDVSQGFSDASVSVGWGRAGNG